MARRTVLMPHAALGFDTIARLSRDQYAAMRALGFQYAIRYLGDLTSDEVDDCCLHAGLGIVPVQHAHAVGWIPSAELGTADGAAAVRDAVTARLPPCELWADLEGCNPVTTHDQVLAWSVTWCRPVTITSNDAGVYVGGATPEDAHALYSLPFTGYWESESAVAAPWRRGFKLVQLFCAPKGECLVRDVFPNAPTLVRNLQIDVDVSRSDYLGGRCRMVIDDGVAAAAA
jgi:hypothetical protein